MLVLIAGEKGGSGKSTLAIQLAIYAAAQGQKVLLVDGDPQATSINWIRRRKRFSDLPMPDTVAMRAPDFRHHLGDLVDRYEHVFIDIAGRDNDEMRTALSFVDLALFPLRPTQLDLETAPGMNALVGEFRHINSYLRKALFIVSQASPNPNRSTTLYEAQEFLMGFEHIELADNFLCLRSAYEHASRDGLAVYEVRPADKQAAEEFYAVYDEVMAA